MPLSLTKKKNRYKNMFTILFPDTQKATLIFQDFFQKNGNPGDMSFHDKGGRGHLLSLWCTPGVGGTQMLSSSYRQNQWAEKRGFCQSMHEKRQLNWCNNRSPSEKKQHPKSNAIRDSKTDGNVKIIAREGSKILK